MIADTSRTAPFPNGQDDVDPDIRRFQQAIEGGYAAHASGPEKTVAERRRVAELVRAPWREGGPVMARTDELRAGGTGVRVRIHRPSLEPGLPVLIYIHGGGWVLFSLDTHDRLMREYAARSGAVVVGVDYTRSPEAKFPQAIDEIVGVVEWLRNAGASLGLDPARIAVAGDSVGANMSVAVNLRLRERGLGVLAAMLLNYGAFDHQETPSHARYGGPAYMLNSAEMVEFWASYLRGPEDYADPLAVPLRAHLTGLPPAFLCIAQCDILADENRQMAGRLRAASVPVEEQIYPGATHSFLEAVSISPLADKALTEASDWLAQRLGIAR